MPVAKRDYYEVLGLERAATADQIKQAFRRLAMKHHPDRHATNKKEAEERFKEISEAYEVLSDPQKRAAYDQYGHGGVEGMFRGGFDFGRDFTHFEDVSDLFGGLEDLFATFGLGDLLGGRVRGRRGGHRAGLAGADLEVPLEIDLNDVLKGKEQRLLLRRREVCEECRGEGSRGATPRVTCPDCQGQGQVRHTQGFFTMATTCGRCRGEGKVVKELCPSCGGEGRRPMGKHLTVKVPPGVETGMRLVMEGEGDAGARGGPRGDTYVAIRVRPHPFFQRNGTELLCEVPISMIQAALGAELKVPTLEGTATVKVPPGTQPGDLLRLRGLGLPPVPRRIGEDRSNKERGDQMVRLAVEIPKRVTPAQRRLLEEFAQGADQGIFPTIQKFWEQVRGWMK